MSTFLQQLINGVSLGAIYSLIALGYTMVYGVLKLINFAHGDVYMVGAFMGYYLANGLGVRGAEALGMSAEVSLALAVFAEVFCSILLLVGFATRLAVIPLAITMLVAVFLIHAADPLSVKEPALHYLLVYIVLLLAGSGKYSIDYVLQLKRATTSYRNQKVQDRALAIYQ